MDRDVPSDYILYLSEFKKKKNGIIFLVFNVYVGEAAIKNH